MKISEASEALQRIGLSRYEALVFVNLARAGAATAGDVARASGVNRVQTYRALEGLEARGLVEVTLDRPRRYAARALQDVFDMIADEKKAELEKLDAVRKMLLEEWPKISGRTREPPLVRPQLTKGGPRSTPTPPRSSAPPGKEASPSPPRKASRDPNRQGSTRFPS